MRLKNNVPVRPGNLLSSFWNETPKWLVQDYYITKLEGTYVSFNQSLLTWRIGEEKHVYEKRTTALNLQIVPQEVASGSREWMLFLWKDLEVVIWIVQLVP